MPDDFSDLSVAELKPKKKSKQEKAKAQDTQADEPIVEVVEEQGDVKPKKKRKRGKEEALDSNENVEPSSNDAEPIETSDVVAEPPKKKKRKEKKAGTTAAPDEPTSEPPPKKKKKEKKPKAVPLPEVEGVELNEQSAKCLTYAHEQVVQAKSWKFNKGKQNWLIRNIWDETQIPEGYLEITIKYLSTVQGGAREVLKKTAQSHLEAPVSAVTSTEATEAEDASPTVKKQRAQLLLEHLKDS
ncbi:hypothetical protein SISNIDRAFT_546649 [Sistotremastrum niveocremeum HHB9708]|uniref:WKF domain-containing protein n=2 Tax=Sistotremastraceae TaxID=3402574 RepID=A0A164Z4U8_9AGAM|nr:hypothetical protein SISNIDRAFT_546649 [Sistotremastrum niveocremeum HHB9708]KZT37651.1 hypothetical protein SISSUDRAFT_1129455 [Sistotremastrum suecicum HHB10207 ss-3]